MSRSRLLIPLMVVGAVLIVATAEPARVATSDTLEQFAQKCDQAIGVTVPDFSCDAGTLVPTTNHANGKCDRPNRLNRECDPGSRFQVLTNSPDAYVVAHCRKQNHAAGRYGDIAIIQHSRTNGATCFYQALGNRQPSGDLDGQVKAPSRGQSAYPWMSPGEIASSSFPCAGCHDNGPLIRSPYLAQLTGPNKLPGSGDFTFNRDQPYTFVGADFASWKAYKVEVTGNMCNGCHRMGTSNLPMDRGTALVFGIRATDPSEIAKNDHSPTSPIWMTPGQITYNATNAAAAAAIRSCAQRRNENPLPNSATCRITQFTGLSVPDLRADGALLRETNGAIWVIFGGAKFHVPDMPTLNALFAGVPVSQVADGALDGVSGIPANGTLLRETNGAIWVVYGGAKFQVPDMPTLNALFAGIPVHQLWDGALNGIPAVPVDRTLLRETSGAIWVVFRGAKFQVPSVTTLNALFAGVPAYQLWNGAVAAIPNIPIDGTLLRETNGAIWVVYGGAKFHVPDPPTLNALLGGVPLYQLWDGALAGIPDVPVDGTLLRETSGTIWVVYGGAKFHVPDVPTLNALFSGVPVRQLWDGALAGIPDAPADGTLLRETSGAIWVVYGGAKFHVPDMPTLNALFSGVPVRQLWDGALAGIPDAPADGTLLRETNGAIWVVFGRAKFHVPDPPTLNTLFAGAPVRQLWDGALAGFSNIPINGTLLRERSSAQVFVIIGGQKTPAPPGTMGTVHVLWDGALAQIP